MKNSLFAVEHLTDFKELSSFYCGENQMDEFIHGNLQECSENHFVLLIVFVKRKQGKLLQFFRCPLIR